MSPVEEARNAMTPSKKKKIRADSDQYVSTGSTLLNLACTGFTTRGFRKGFYYFFVGDSQSGKTFLCMTSLAEAHINPNFSNYRFIMDEPEQGALMDRSAFFGKGCSDRIEPPAGTRKDPKFSETIEDFYYHLDDACKKGIPFIYILDSMDSLYSEAADKKFEANKKIHRKGKGSDDTEEDPDTPKKKGSYGDGKAKENSDKIRRFIPKLAKMGSILIIINQTRDNIPQPGQFTFEKKTRSGGHALKFYATFELWSSVKIPITKLVKGKKRKIGAVSKVAVKKNRIIGRDRVVEIPFYYSYGFDDTRACVDYLVEEKHWAGKTETVSAPEFDFKGKKIDLVNKIEEEGKEKELRLLVKKTWQEIEALCKVDRKPRYV